MIVEVSPRRYINDMFQIDLRCCVVSLMIFAAVFVFHFFPTSPLICPKDVQMALAMDSYADDLLPVSSNANNDDDAGTTQVTKPGVNGVVHQEVVKDEAKEEHCEGQDVI
jgi:hypothetical protein